MNDQTSELLQKNAQQDPDHPRRPLKLDQLATQHRENYNAEARRAGQPEAQPEQQASASNVDYGDRSFDQQRQQYQSGLTYTQRALRGEFGEDLRQKAIDAYNGGRELEEPAPGGTSQQAGRNDGSQLSTRLHDRGAELYEGAGQPQLTEQNAQRSSDLQSIAGKPAADASAPQPASVTAPAPVNVAGESSTPSKTVTKVDATQPNTPPAGGNTVKQG